MRAVRCTADSPDCLIYRWENSEEVHPISDPPPASFSPAWRNSRPATRKKTPRAVRRLPLVSGKGRSVPRRGITQCTYTSHHLDDPQAKSRPLFLGVRLCSHKHGEVWLLSTAQDCLERRTDTTERLFVLVLFVSQSSFPSTFPF